MPVKLLAAATCDEIDYSTTRLPELRCGYGCNHTKLLDRVNCRNRKQRDTRTDVSIADAIHQKVDRVAPRSVY